MSIWGCAPQPPVASQGILDLTGWDFEKSGPVNLSGQWEFYWQERYNPDDFKNKTALENKTFANVPGIWRKFDTNGPHPASHGYATYRLVVLLKDAGQSYSLRLKNINTACDLFVNGRRVEHLGQVGTSVATSRPRTISTMVDLHFSNPRAEIILNISNFHMNAGGILSAIKFGPESQMHRWRERTIAIELFLFGGIFISGLYQLSLFAYRRKYTASLYFGIFCLLIALRGILTGDYSLAAPLSAHSWEWTLRLYLIPFYLAVPIFLNFIHALYPAELPRRSITPLLVLCLVCIMATTLAPARVHIHLLKPYEWVTLFYVTFAVWALLRAFFRKREGARVFLGGFAVLALTVFNDILFDMGWLHTGFLASYGLFLFILTQTIQISLRFSKAFDTVEKQKLELDQIRDHLETRVNERTAALKRAYEDLLTEIAERKWAVDALQESEEKYRQLFEMESDAIFMVDGRNHLILEVNPASKSLYGYSRQALIGMKFDALEHPTPKGGIAGGPNPPVKDNAAESAVHYHLKKDGTRFPVEISIRTFTWQGHEVFVATIRDITERLKAQEEKFELLRQLHFAERMEAIGNLAGGIAHDFNNLLMGIQGNVSLMLLQTDSEHKSFHRLKAIENHIRSGAQLTAKLLGFARGGNYEVKPLNLNTVVLKSSEMFRRTHKEITLELELAPNLWLVNADQVQIEQVLLNLFVNAWQAMPQTGTIFVKTRNLRLPENDARQHDTRENAYVGISVEDTGEGMAPEVLKRIFDPFFTTKDRHRGTGLGLASTYGIVKSHGGFITVNSTKGQGTIFDIRLPAVNSDPAEVKM